MFDFRSCMDHCTIKNISPTEICSKTLHCKFEKSRLFIHISHTFPSHFLFVVCIDHCTVVNNSRIEIGSKTLQVQFKMCRLSLQLKFLSVKKTATSYLFKSNLAMLFRPGLTAIFSGCRSMPLCCL